MVNKDKDKKPRARNTRLTLDEKIARRNREKAKEENKEAKIVQISKVKFNSKKFTDKELDFLRSIGEGNSPKIAAFEAYDVNTNRANAVASKVLNKPNIREAIVKIFEKNDVTLDRAVEPFIKGLTAKKTYNGADGLEESDVDDLGMQMKAGEKIMKLMGVEDNSKENVGNNYIQVNNYHKNKYND